MPDPVAPRDRLVHIDIIRGLALFGVLIVNLESGFRIPLLEHISGGGHAVTPAGQAVQFFISRFLEFKALTLFSFLFGVGIAHQAERARPRDFGFLARRFAVLFLIGLIHIVLIWNGDILTLYSVCGLLLLPLVRLPWPALGVLGAAILLVPIPWGFHIEDSAAFIEQARNTYGHGTIGGILSFRWHETRTLIMPLLAGILPRTCALMCCGMAAWKTGLLRDPRLYRKPLAVTLAISIPLAAWMPDTPALTALAYLTALLLLLTPERAARLPGLAALGRMALTNYLTQSVVWGFVFYSYGLGLLGTLSPEAAFASGVALFLTQVWLSQIWLSRFRHGPVEWVWRRLTY